MSGSKQTHRIIRVTGSVIYADNGSTKAKWNSITLSREDLAAYKRMKWITSGRPTLLVTGLKVQDVLLIPGWLPSNKLFAILENGKIGGRS